MSEKKENETVQLTVEAIVHEDALFMRTELATAEGDGFKVEIASGLLGAGGTVLVTYSTDAEPKKWTTYALSPDALVDAVIAAHKERTAAE